MEVAIKKCKYCGTTENLKTDKRNVVYPVCVTCVPLDSKIKAEKRKKTNLEKYGVENPFQSKDVQQKIKKTNLEKYGVEHPIQSKLIKEKAKQTCLKRYGVENPAQNENCKEKAKQTCLEKYGVANPNQCEFVKTKSKKTNLKRYGVDNPSKNSDIKNKIKQTTLEKYGDENYRNIEKSKETKYKNHGDEYYRNIEKSKKTNLKRYGVDNPLKNKDIQIKIKQTNLKRYGSESPLGNKDVQEKIRRTNLEKYGVEYLVNNKEIQKKQRKTFKKNYWETFNLKLKEKRLDLLFNKNYYINNEQHFKFKCLRCGINFEKNTTDPNYISCICTKKRSYYEDEIIDWLKTIGIKNIVSNKRFYDDKTYKYEIDIYLPDFKLGIDFGGVYWHSDLYKKNNYHQKKYFYFSEHGIQILQIFENEWLESKNIIKSIIKNKLGKSDRLIYGRKCVITKLNTQIAKEFLNNNHLQKFIPASEYLGLLYNNELVSIATFKKARFDNSNSWELIRFANKLNTNVIGGFSRLLNNFQKKINKDIISFVDLRYFNGSGYKQSGFSFVKYTKPNYYYVSIKKNKIKLYNRLSCQKHKLSKFLEKFNPDMSEYDNMKLNGFFRVFDAGNIKLIKKYF